MKDKAIAKITQEAMAIDDPFAIALEEHLTERCTTNSIAEKLLADDKSLKTIYDKIYEEARKKAKHQRAVMRSDEVFDMVDKYYGIDSEHAPAQRGSADRVNVLDLF